MKNNYVIIAISIICSMTIGILYIDISRFISVIIFMIITVLLLIFMMITTNQQFKYFNYSISIGVLFSGVAYLLRGFHYFGIIHLNGSEIGIDSMMFSYVRIIAVIALLCALPQVGKKKISLYILILQIFLMSSALLIMLSNYVPEFYVSNEYTEYKFYHEYLVLVSLFVCLPFILFKKELLNSKIYFNIVTVVLLLIITEVISLLNLGYYNILFVLREQFFLFALFFIANAVINEIIIKKDRNYVENLENELQALYTQITKTQNNETVFRSLYDDAPLGYQSLDINGRFIHVNNAYAKMLGYTKEEMIGKKFTDFMNERSMEEMPNRFQSFLRRGEVDVIFSMKHRNGREVPVRFLGKIAYKEDGDFKQTHCILLDISNEVEYQKGIVEGKHKLNEIVENLTTGVLYVNTLGDCIYVNERFMQLVGYSKDELVGKLICEIFEAGHGGEPDFSKSTLYKTVIEKGFKLKQKEKLLYRKSDTPIEVLLSAEPIKDNGVIQGAIVTVVMKNSSSAVTESLIRMSYHDSLTGVFNRRYYEDELKNIDIEENLPISLISADINGLKLINDAFGHQAGDELILNTVKIFTKHSRNKDVIARIGGDEFVIIMTKTSNQEANDRVEKMILNSREYHIKSIELSISFGVATKLKPTEDIREIFTKAEDEMYRVKLMEVPPMRSQAIESILNSLFDVDKRLVEHTFRVSRIAVLIARKLGYKEELVKQLKTLATYHDIGQITLPKELILKGTQYTEDEIEVIRKHSETGFRILNSSNVLRALSYYVLSHHERWDGTGVPQGLKGTDIPIQSRILYMCEILDEYLSDGRMYGKLEKNELVKTLQNDANKKFDEEIVRVVVDNIDKIFEIVESQ